MNRLLSIRHYKSLNSRNEKNTGTFNFMSVPNDSLRPSGTHGGVGSGSSCIFLSLQQPSLLNPVSFSLVPLNRQGWRAPQGEEEEKKGEEEEVVR